MKVDLEVAKMIEILIDEDKNIAIFPYSQSDIPFDDTNIEIGFKWFTAYFPIELKTPYTINKLASAIEYGINEENKHPYYYYKNHNNKTLEELYYGEKGFSKVMKGKKMINLGWNDRWGKYASLMLPDKRGYSYTGVKLIYLDDLADWTDFAESVITLINYDPKRDK